MSDITTLALFAALLVLHLLFVKKQHLFNHLIALYASIAAVMLLPRIPALASWIPRIPYGRAGAFVLMLLGLHLLLRMSNLDWFSKRVASGGTGTSVLYHIALTGLFFSALLLFAGTTIGPIATMIFKNTIALFAWAIVPLFLAFSYRFKTKTGWLA